MTAKEIKETAPMSGRQCHGTESVAGKEVNSLRYVGYEILGNNDIFKMYSLESALNHRCQIVRNWPDFSDRVSIPST